MSNVSSTENATGVFIELDYDDGSSWGLTVLLDPAAIKSWVEKTRHTNYF